ncbi:hypothetical protein, partial [Sphingomonas sp.]|uniref:hypothetical protein n=1 Tax=Sphingomonas sp. TaxID=28214 RepID=UPI002EDA7E7A
MGLTRPAAHRSPPASLSFLDALGLAEFDDQSVRDAGEARLVEVATLWPVVVAVLALTSAGLVGALSWWNQLTAGTTALAVALAALALGGWALLALPVARTLAPHRRTGLLAGLAALLAVTL